jgi:hypothetical protein
VANIFTKKSKPKPEPAIATAAAAPEPDSNSSSTSGNSSTSSTRINIFCAIAKIKKKEVSRFWILFYFFITLFWAFLGEGARHHHTPVFF